jgi:hypothetical protein
MEALLRREILEPAEDEPDPVADARELCQTRSLAPSTTVRSLKIRASRSVNAP